MPYKYDRKNVGSGDLVRELGRLKKHAVVSPDLRAAIVEAEAAMKRGDYPLAEELTAVKSYIVTTGTQADALAHGDHFWEDSGRNEDRFGDDVYGILDSMTHELSLANGSIPAGSTIMRGTEGGGLVFSQRPQPKQESPTLDLIRQEHTEIVAESERFFREKDLRGE